ncbi:MAG: hypothetical protein KGL59_05350 [Acidobacteriota bacterium]|nr:hypothetical protein [Acidobacteriota bacterium]
MDISPLHLLLLVMVVGAGVVVPVVYIFLGFSAVRLLREIRDALRAQQLSS